jgi:hypothetical protein
MKKLVVEMKIITDRMVHYMGKTLFNFEVFLPADMTEIALQSGSAIEAIIFMSVMLFHDGLH